MVAKTKLVMVLCLVLMLIGIALPLLMVVRVIESSFLLNFLAYGSSVAGLFLGVLAVMSHTKNKRDRM